MRSFYIDLDESDFVDELLREIEQDYGRSIARIAYFQAGEMPNTYNLKVIFSDFMLLDATIEIQQRFDYPTIQVRGIYF